MGKEEGAKKITVIGVVQGVGFRPFVYRIASSLGLKGYVKNLGGSEVVIHVEGDSDDIEKLIDAIKKSHPPMAVIERIHVTEDEMEGWKSFEIASSGNAVEEASMIPPDIGICQDCLREIKEKSSRFYRYPFHSCVNCGPRYSMMLRPPYDRENTSMRLFPLCEKCSEEYRDPKNERRFFAQGISCPLCGPKVRLLDSYGRFFDSEDPISEAGRLIEKGYIVAVKGVGGYHLASLATSDNVVKELRRRKKRSRKPFALMAKDLFTVERHAYVSDAERDLLLSPQRPIVLLKRKEKSEISPEVAPGLGSIGVMLPYSALHFLLLDAMDDGIAVMTSANISGDPTCTSLSCVMEKLGDSVDYILDHDRPIVNRVDDSVMKVVEGETLLTRRSRGFAPTWIEVGFDFPKTVVALGAFLNNTGAVAFGNKVILTPHIGDMDSFESLRFLFSSLNKLGYWYGLLKEKSAVVVDKHPSFPQKRSYKRALHYNFDVQVEVQHHCAHAFQVFPGRSLDDLLGASAITIDGTGYGEDGGIWGGEVMLIEKGGCRRVASLREFPLIGGDLAAKEAIRPLVGILRSYFGEEAESLLESIPLDFHLKEKGKKLIRAIEKGHSFLPMSSSLGRLLDAVGCASSIECFSDYDGEIPMRIEDLSDGGKEIDLPGHNEFERDGVRFIDFKNALSLLPYLKSIGAKDYLYSLQLEIGRAFGRIAAKLSRNGVIILSGGAAVNRFILKGIKEEINAEGKRLIMPSQVPPGDGGISIGQAIYAGLKLNGML